MDYKEKRRITELTLKAVSGHISPEEQAELSVYLDASTENQARYDKRIEKHRVQQKLRIIEQWEQGEEKEIGYALEMLSKRRSPVFLTFKKLAVAASIVILATGGYIFFKGKKSSASSVSTVLAKPDDLKPGGNRAVLTLADGHVVDLDSTANGLVASQGNAQVTKLANGQLAYEKDATGGGGEEKVVYNTLTIPRGGQYQLSLPDGSQVWLNNASSLRYPTNFSGSSREVELSGEALFTVAKNPAKPFRVRIRSAGNASGGDEVEVLGTTFTISAYPDETSERTTLIDGSIRLDHAGKRQVLKPAEQAIVEGNGQTQLLKGVDVDGVMAWKNGRFHFENSSIQDVMRQLSRWYDIEEISYHQPLAKHLFSGDVPKDLSLSQIAEILGHHIHFVIQGKKIAVSAENEQLKE